MFTFDAVFYKRNAVLDEQPFWLVPSKWMIRAHSDDYTFNPHADESLVPPAILHGCRHAKIYRGESHGQFLPEDIDHNWRCKECLMRPSDKMITLFTLLK
jgi:hypothetical protein